MKHLIFSKSENVTATAYGIFHLDTGHQCWSNTGKRMRDEIVSKLWNWIKFTEKILWFCRNVERGFNQKIEKNVLYVFYHSLILWKTYEKDYFGPTFEIETPGWVRQQIYLLWTTNHLTSWEKSLKYSNKHCCNHRNHWLWNRKWNSLFSALPILFKKFDS